MSCYIRHLKGIFEEAGIELTPANKKEIDRTLHRMAGIEYKNCPAAWAQLKQYLADEQKRREIVIKLREALK
ncbi:MAG: hypothetical protein IBX68_10315 [Dehalococcoidia bacterium]|nr:hypothetical protein [Dehalococcoidia bacterium]